MDKLRIEYVPINTLKPYLGNAKEHPDWQIEQIKLSMEEFGNLDPIGVWHDEIVEGHGRLIAAKELGYKEVPVIRLDGLSDQQRRAYTIVHNKLTMNTDFDLEKLQAELDALKEVDMSSYGFGDLEKELDWFEKRHEYDSGEDDEDNEEYQAFVDKFKAKKTTDDCYTPDNVYDAVADWVADEYKLDKSKFVRPFYPGGDYQKRQYKKDEVVVDNPPFSILAEIMKFFCEGGVRFFLFSPTLTALASDHLGICHVICNAQIEYENGAVVNTSFQTNMENGVAVRTAPELHEAIEKANDENTASKNELLKYSYPENVITAAMVARFAEYGVGFDLNRAEVKKVSALDAQKEKGLGMFGGGYLISDDAAAQAKKAAQAAGVPEDQINENGEVIWDLSEREREIIEELNIKAEKAINAKQ